MDDELKGVTWEMEPKSIYEQQVKILQDMQMLCIETGNYDAVLRFSDMIVKIMVLDDERKR